MTQERKKELMAELVATEKSLRQVEKQHSRKVDEIAREEQRLLREMQTRHRKILRPLEREVDKLFKKHSRLEKKVNPNYCPTCKRMR